MTNVALFYISLLKIMDFLLLLQIIILVIIYKLVNKTLLKKIKKILTLNIFKSLPLNLPYFFRKKQLTLFSKSSLFSQTLLLFLANHLKIILVFSSFLVLIINSFNVKITNFLFLLMADKLSSNSGLKWQKFLKILKKNTLKNNLKNKTLSTIMDNMLKTFIKLLTTIILHQKNLMILYLMTTSTTCSLNQTNIANILPTLSMVKSSLLPKYMIWNILNNFSTFMTKKIMVRLCFLTVQINLENMKLTVVFGICKVASKSLNLKFVITLLSCLMKLLNSLMILRICVENLSNADSIKLETIYTTMFVLINICLKPTNIDKLNLIIIHIIYTFKTVLSILIHASLLKQLLICIIHFKSIMIMTNLLSMMKFIISYLKLCNKMNLIGF